MCRRISESVQDTDHGYNDGLIGSRIRAFDWFQNHRPRMIVNGRYVLYGRKATSFGAQHKILSEDRPTLSAVGQ